uniref:TSA: Wollemia nobilis Ref_Wollemi_Transcript_12453_2652 transcribed RNA sequence n=1 Tax=Wollemia nobilis TaxID=56998 RepID=A0A0C9QRW6_9CONI
MLAEQQQQQQVMAKILGGTLRRNKGYVSLDGQNRWKVSRHGKNERTLHRLWYRCVGLFAWIFVSLYVCGSMPDFFTFDWRQEKGAFRDGGIRKSVVRSRGLAASVVAEENFSHGRLSKNVYSDAVGKVSGLSSDIKVYVYNLPAKYNEDWLENSRCDSHLFAAEVAIHRALMSSSVRVMDPGEADFFFVPVYVSCNFSSKNGFPSLGHARPLLGSAVEYISGALPFWNRSGGADHVFAATHDYGACFHAMEDVAVSDGVPLFLQNSIILQTFGVKGKHPCQDVEHIQIPPYVPPMSIEATLGSVPPQKHKRDIWVFFRGKMEIHPKNISGRIYSKGVRTTIWQKFGHNRKFYIKRKRYGGYQSEILRSVFCLCPLGWAPWSPRIVESVSLGCVPVIIADNISLPYSDAIPWPKISLTVPERDVAKLGKILDKVAATNLTSIQRNLWKQANRRALLFTEPIQNGDATWQVLEALTRRMDRSHRNRTSTSS